MPTLGRKRKAALSGLEGLLEVGLVGRRDGGRCQGRYMHTFGGLANLLFNYFRGHGERHFSEFLLALSGDPLSLSTLRFAS